MKALRLLSLFALLLPLLFSSGCRKDQITDDPSAVLSFSVDTLTFDTVFTTLGTTTKRFKVFNNQSQKVVISSIDLAGGDGSNFRINVDGLPGDHHEDIEIAAEDSIYVFVEATVDPNNGLNPLIILDSIQFITNGNRQQVVLAAWGQDAHFINGQLIGDSTWTNDKPWVIINSMQVDTGATLTIEAGTQIYCSANSGILVSGQLVVNGGCGLDSVVFQGLRLENFYDDVPGQWQGIFLLRGAGMMPNPVSTIKNAVIKNSNFGLTIGSAFTNDLSQFTTGNQPTANLENVTIKNNFSTGLYCFFATVTGKNLLVYNSGDNLVTLGLGGTYDFDHCSFLNYGSVTTNHEKQILLVSNLAGNDQLTVVNNLDATFTNSIIDGSLDNELSITRDQSQGNDYTLLFDHCIVKLEVDTPAGRFVNVQFNVDPVYKDRGEEDYHLATGSPAIDGGTGSEDDDLDCVVRSLPPDIGCYEFVP